jgi:hypothetical protein
LPSLRLFSPVRSATFDMTEAMDVSTAPVCNQPTRDCVSVYVYVYSVCLYVRLCVVCVQVLLFVFGLSKEEQWGKEERVLPPWHG